MVTVEKFFSFSVLINKEYSYEIRAYTDALNFAKSVSHLPKKMFYLLQWKPFKNDEKCVSFHLKGSFCSQDI